MIFVLGSEAEYLLEEEAEENEKFEWKIPLKEFGGRRNAKFLIREFAKTIDGHAIHRGKIINLFDKAKGLDEMDYDNEWESFNLDYDDIRSTYIGKALKELGVTEEDFDKLQEAANMSRIKYFILDFKREFTAFYKKDYDEVWAAMQDIVFEHEEFEAEDNDGVVQEYERDYAYGDGTPNVEAAVDIINELYTVSFIGGRRHLSITSLPTYESVRDKIVTIMNNHESVGGDDSTVLTTTPQQDAIGAAFEIAAQGSGSVHDFARIEGNQIYIEKRGLSMLTIQRWIDEFIPMLDVRFKRKTSWWRRFLAFLVFVFAIYTFITGIGQLIVGQLSTTAMFSTALDVIGAGLSIYNYINPPEMGVEDEETEEEDDDTLSEDEGIETPNNFYSWERPNRAEVERYKPEGLRGRPKALLERTEQYAS